MVIDHNTRLAVLFKFNRGALDAVVGLNTNFAKLKNPFLRKIMAPRTTISMAAKIGGCSPNDFFEVLQPLGFTVSENNSGPEPAGHKKLIDNLNIIPTIMLDVRPVLSAGDDPLRLILEKASSLQPGEILCIKNSFEPLPLIALLQKKGFNARTLKKAEHEYDTYFQKVSSPLVEDPQLNDNWNDTEEKFRNNFFHLDVREMSAPFPMVTILEELAHLPEGKALYVHHKRVPLYLLPELKERGFGCVTRQTGKDEVQLLIFKPKDAGH